MRNFSWIGTDEAATSHGCITRAWVPFVAALVCCSFPNCTDYTALSERLRTEGYLETKAIATVSRALSELTTVVNVCSYILLPCTGPRILAGTGAALVLAGQLLMTQMGRPANESLVVSALTLQAFGGGFVFVSCMSFSNLMPKRRAFLDGILSSCYTAAPTLCLAFVNDHSIPLELWYSVLAPVSLVTCVLAVVFFPDMPYETGDQAAIMMPSLRRKRANTKSSSQYLQAFRDARFVGFLLTYVWVSAAADWYSAAFYALRADSAPKGYFKWEVPLAGNAAMMVSAPLAGILIDKTVNRVGYALSGVVMIVLSCAMLLSLLSSETAVLYASLVGTNLLGSLNYMTELPYIQRCYPVEALPLLLMMCELGHFAAGLLNYPVLARNPWGNNYLPPILLFLLPQIPMFAWPVLEVLRVGKPLRGGRGWQDCDEPAAPALTSSEPLQHPMCEATGADVWPEAAVLEATQPAVPDMT